MGQARTEPAKEQCRLRAGADRRRSTRTVGEAQRKEDRFNHCPQKNDVSSLPQKDRSCSESTVGKMAEGTEGLVQIIPL